MVPSGPPTPIGGAQSVTPSMLRSNSGMLGGQGAPMPSQGAFPSLVSPRNQFNNGNMLGNVPNVSSLINHSFGNGNASSGIHGPANGPRGGNNGGAEPDPLSGIANGFGFNSPSNMANPSTSGQVHGQHFPNPSGDHMLPDQSQSQSQSQSQTQTQQLESQNFQHPQQPFQQYPTNQQPFQSIRGGLGGGGGPMKSEPQAVGDQHRTPQNQNVGQVKLEPQQLQNMRGVGPGTVKTEPQQSSQSLFLQQQQQQQQQQQHQLMQQMSLSRQSSQVAQMNILQQQRMLQLQQQQQLLKSMPQQRPQFSPQNLPLRSPVKAVYEPGMCARRLTHYMYQQQHRPEDNSIEFWRKFVAEYFAPNAKKKWCVSMYGSGRQTSGVFPQDVWHCEICKRKPGRGFEATVEVLPRLFKIKYESGTLEELLYVDMPREYQNSSGQIVLDYAKAIQESVFEQLRVVRDGQLRLVFSPDLKICSWEFCARRHEELIPRRLLIPQVSQLGTVAQKYQAAAQNSSSSMSISELQGNRNMFVASARQLAKALEVPLVNDLGYTKRYVRCLQISEVVNSMKDLIDYSRLTGEGPMESLAKFPRRSGTPSALQRQNQQAEEQQEQGVVQSSNNNDQSSDRSGQAGSNQVPVTNGMACVNNSPNVSSSSTSHSTIAGLLHQNSMNSRHQNPMINSNSPYGTLNSVQMPSPGSSSTMQQTQQNLSPFQSPTPSSNNPLQASHGTLAGPGPPAMSSDGDTNNDTQSSVQKFIQEMMTNNQPGPNGPTSMGGGPFGGIGGGMGMGMGMGQASLVNGFRGAVGNNSMNGRVSMNQQPPQLQQHQHQHDMGNQMLSGLGAVNGFNGLQFDWKPSP